MGLHPYEVNDPSGVLVPYLHVPGFTGTSAQRITYGTSYTGYLKKSMTWFETDTNNTYQWLGTSAIKWLPITSTSAISVSTGINQLTGDGTALGPGSSVLTLATVNGNVGTFGSSTSIPVITANAKGLITAVGTSAVSVASISPTAITGGTSGQYLGQNSSNVPTWTTLKAPTVQKFLGGTSTYTTPANVLYLRVRMAGGGGGGQGYGASLGTSGLSSTFGTNLLLAGGGPSLNSANAVGSFTINAPAYGQGWPGGAGGGPAIGGTADTGAVSGATGGSNMFGGAGNSGPFSLTAPGSNGTANTGAGGGGSGSGTNNSNAGGWGGSAGGCLDAIIPNPSGNYIVVVGAGGAGSTGSQNGGNGANGIVLVEEFYQ